MLTNYMSNCIICGRPSENTHHLCYNRANRRLSDADELLLPLCLKHHDEIHRNGTAGALSKMLGQMAYERDRCAEGVSIENAREMFRKRYGESYL